MPTPHTRLAARLAPLVTDGDLLARFVRDRDEAAFAALVHRHGPTVLGVCRRVLGHPTDAEDAFQAVFLVLANRADSLLGQRTLGGWLHGVAVRVAMQARVALARRRKHERAAAERRPESGLDPTPAEPSWIDRELSALPDKFRDPVVLCLLQDRPRAEVAAELGIPEGTLASRLDTARKRLADRLARHRVPLVLAGLLAPVSAALADAAVRRADGADMAIHQLANEVTRSMLTNANWRVLFAAGVLTAAIGGLLLAAPAPSPVARRPAPVPEPKVPKWKQEFDKFYSLKDDELVKVVPRSERPDCRREFVRDRLLNREWRRIKPEQLDKVFEHYEQTQSYVFEIDSKGKRGQVWDVDGSEERPPNGPSEQLGVSIFTLAYYLARIERYEIDYDPHATALTYMDMPDFVVRSDAPWEKLIPALDKALAEKLNVQFKMEWKEEEKEVWVASGKLDLKPRAWRKAGQVDVYADEKAVDKSEERRAKRDEDRTQKGGVPVFLKGLRERLGTWVLWDDGEPPAKPEFEWMYHLRRGPTEKEYDADRNPEKVLPNVSEQTGLTFKKEKRKVPVVVVSLRKGE